jgi:hypothetical protein
MTRIVTTTYRYKPPPRKRKAAPLAGPALVTPKRKRVLPAEGKTPATAVVRKTKPGNDNRPDPAPLPTDGQKSAIVTVKREGRFGEVPDLPPEEHRRRGDAADALWRELVRRTTGKDRP